MGNIAITTENLGKRYRLGATVDLSRTFREAIIEFPKKFMGQARRKAWELKQAMSDPNYDPETPPGTFWALRDINLEINHGDVVGIIGRNGAGKSTLLKILSKITTPTKGIAKIHGRVGSLLEVGTGFHPELTGKENIYLNGSILGMTKAEIDKKFDEIVAFAEVEQFLDTPIKRYSSGMQVRLAFAVAAHLEPEILVVDEVLAVGDAAFQKKCLGKMEDVSKEGRTILFVSHNMLAVKKLCRKSILLEKGNLELMGHTEDIVTKYFESKEHLTSQYWENKNEAPGNDIIRINKIKIFNQEKKKDDFFIDDTLEINIDFWVLSINELNISMMVKDENNQIAFAITNKPKEYDIGLYSNQFFIKKGLLNSISYSIDLMIVKNAKVILKSNDVLQFKIKENADSRSGWYGKYPGVVRPVIETKTNYLSK